MRTFFRVSQMIQYTRYTRSYTHSKALAVGLQAAGAELGLLNDWYPARLRCIIALTVSYAHPGAPSIMGMVCHTSLPTLIRHKHHAASQATAIIKRAIPQTPIVHPMYADAVVFCCYGWPAVVKPTNHPSQTSHASTC